MSDILYNIKKKTVKFVLFMLKVYYLKIYVDLD